MPDGTTLKIGEALLDYQQNLERAVRMIEEAEEKMEMIRESLAGEMTYQGKNEQLLQEIAEVQTNHIVALREQYQIAASYCKEVHANMNDVDRQMTGAMQ